MSLIICATDFSEVAENAVDYACQLSLTTNSELLLLHCYTIPVMFTDMPVPFPANEAEQVSEDTLKEITATVKGRYPQLTIHSLVVYGDIIDAITNYTEQYQAPWLVVAGNSYTEQHPAWSESTLLQALRHLTYPILAIPADQSYTSVRKIGLAYDNKYEGSDIALIKVREIVALLGAELHVFYGQPDAVKDGVDTDVNLNAKKILEDVQPLYHVFYNGDVDQAIQELASKYQIDWMAIIPRKHGFPENLFHKSHTKALVNSIHLPLLALHHS